MSTAATSVSYNLPAGVAELACELTDSSVNYGARVANNSWGAIATAIRFFPGGNRIGVGLAVFDRLEETSVFPLVYE